MDDARETFMNGVLAFAHAMKAIHLHPDQMTVVLPEKDGIALEHHLTQEQCLVVSGAHDPRYSTPKADKHVREFKVAGVTFQYRTKPFILPSGEIV